MNVFRWKDEYLKTEHTCKDHFDSNFGQVCWCLFLDFLKSVLSVKNDWMCEHCYFEANMGHKAVKYGTYLF